MQSPEAVVAAAPSPLLLQVSAAAHCWLDCCLLVENILTMKIGHASRNLMPLISRK